MLNAIEQNKPGCLSRLKGKGLGVGTEDMITSSFLGPLEFIGAGESWRFWNNVFKAAGHKVEPPFGEPEEIRVDFWPKRKIRNDQHSCEPDALIEYTWKNQDRLIILLEFKWKSRLSASSGGKTQLHDQWVEFLSSDEKRDAHHLFIAQETSEGRKAQMLDDVWKGRLLLLPWETIHAVLLALSKDATAKPLSRWSDLTATFLERLNIRAFKGFLGCEKVLAGDHVRFAIAEAANSDELFYRPVRGLASIAPIPALTNLDVPIFCRSN
jgi:hypothetical protein